MKESKASADLAAARLAFNRNLDLAKRIAGALRFRMPPAARRPDTVQVAMGALWETSLKYHQLPDVQFEAMASVRIRGAILDDNRAYDFLPRRARKKFGSGSSVVYLNDQGTHSEKLLQAFATVVDIESELDAAARAKRLEAAISAITNERERYVVRATLRGRAQKQIADDLKVSQARASQLLSRATKKLREAMK